MLLKHILLLNLFILPAAAQAQQNNSPDSSAFSNPAKGVLRAPDDVDVDLLSNYYEQEGSHSAVTGGIGTEKLEDKALGLKVNVPLDEKTRVEFNSAFNHYTSASTDNINHVVSSASSEDIRFFAGAGIAVQDPGKRKTYEIHFGASTETDYQSLGIGTQFSKAAKDRSRTLTLAAQLYFDRIMPVFPEELRNSNRVQLGDIRRRSYSLSASISQVVNERLQGSLSLEGVIQHGLLSTTFHRVYFLGDTLPWMEQLPGLRLKFPATLRLNFFPLDFLVLRSWYRFYADNFGILAHSMSLEPVFKLNSFFSVSPFYRFHTQTASRHFVAHTSVVFGQEYFTSDYDLSAFQSHKIGLGLQFSPLYGIGRWKMMKGLAIFRELDLRGAWYRRSDGLEAWMISAGFSFRYKQKKK